MSEMIKKNNKRILKWLVNNHNKNNKIIQNIINWLILTQIKILYFLKIKKKFQIIINKLKKILKILKIITLIYYNLELNNCKNWKKYKNF